MTSLNLTKNWEGHTFFLLTMIVMLRMKTTIMIMMIITMKTLVMARSIIVVTLMTVMTLLMILTMRMMHQCVANVFFLWKINIQTNMWPPYITKISRMNIFVDKYLNIWIYLNNYNVIFLIHQWMLHSVIHIVPFRKFHKIGGAPL